MEISLENLYICIGLLGPKGLIQTLREPQKVSVLTGFHCKR